MERTTVKRRSVHFFHLLLGTRKNHDVSVFLPRDREDWVYRREEILLKIVFFVTKKENDKKWLEKINREETKIGSIERLERLYSWGRHARSECSEPQDLQPRSPRSNLHNTARDFYFVYSNILE